MTLVKRSKEQGLHSYAWVASRLILISKYKICLFICELKRNFFLLNPHPEKVYISSCHRLHLTTWTRTLINTALIPPHDTQTSTFSQSRLLRYFWHKESGRGRCSCFVFPIIGFVFNSSLSSSVKSTFPFATSHNIAIFITLTLVADRNITKSIKWCYLWWQGRSSKSSLQDVLTFKVWSVGYWVFVHFLNREDEDFRSWMDLGSTEIS